MTEKSLSCVQCGALLLTGFVPWGQFNKETTNVVFLQVQSARVNFRLIPD